MSTRSSSPSQRDKFNPSICNSRDPKLLISRVFVGNLPTDGMSKDEFHDVFSKFGKLLGSAVHKGFGFLQFDREEDARDAVAAMAGSIYKDYKIDIKMASEGRKAAGRGCQNQSSQGGGQDRHEQSYRDRSPVRDYDDGYHEERPVRGESYSFDDTMQRDDTVQNDLVHREDLLREAVDGYGRRSLLPPPECQDTYYSGGPDDDYPPRRYEPLTHGNMYFRDKDLFLESGRPLTNRQQTKRATVDILLSKAPLDRANMYPGHVDRDSENNRLPPGAVERPPFDCSIILYSRQQMEYAEGIENRLKSLAMMTDIHVLAPDAQVTTIVDNLSKRKVPYSIVLNGQNLIHRSLTLNILHGSPQEHRNMPLEDSMGLISRNFEKYLRSLREKPSVPNKKVLLPPDAQTSYLMNLLADGRHLTLDELQSVGDFISERKRRLMEAEGIKQVNAVAFKSSVPSSDPTHTPNAEPLSDPSDILKQQAELQAKILNILNPAPPSPPASSLHTGNSVFLDSLTTVRGVPSVSASLDTNCTSTSVNSSMGLNLDNPHIQKALDSLMSSGGDLMRKISSTAANMSAMGTDLTSGLMNQGTGVGSCTGLMSTKVGFSGLDSLGCLNRPGSEVMCSMDEMGLSGMGMSQPSHMSDMMSMPVVTLRGGTMTRGPTPLMNIQANRGLNSNSGGKSIIESNSISGLRGTGPSLLARFNQSKQNMIGQF